MSCRLPLLALSLALAGCRPPASPATGAGAGGSAGGAGEPTGGSPLDAVYYKSLLDAYAANEFAAAQQYARKPIRTAIRVEGMGRENGRPFLATSAIVGSPRPQLYVRLLAGNDPLLPTIRQGDFCTVDGTLSGRVNDGVDRGISGRDFHLELTDARLVEVAPTYEKLNQAPKYPQR